MLQNRREKSEEDFDIIHLFPCVFLQLKIKKHEKIKRMVGSISFAYFHYHI